MTRHAVYAITDNVKHGEHIAFRVGQPTDWPGAMLRYERLYARSRGIERPGENKPARPVRVKHDGKVYSVKDFEVRAVDQFGRGLGSGRHERAIIAPYRAVRSAKR